MSAAPFDSCPLRWQALHHPQQLAVCLDQRSLSFAELDALVEGCAVRLQGYAPGSCLAAVGRNSLELVILQLACLRLGFRFFALSHRLTTSQLLGALKAASAVALWCGEETPEGLSAKAALAAIDVPLEVGPELTRPVQAVQINSEAPCTLLQTSGSSGQPKIVVHGYRAHYQSALGSQQRIPLTPGDRWLLSLPLFHVGGQAIVWRSVIMGSAIVLSERSMVELLVERKLSHLSLVNTQLYRLIASGVDFTASGLKVLLLGGAAVSPQLLKSLAGTGVKVLTSYGMTEMASQICTGAAHLIHGQLSSGQVLPGRELKLSADGQIMLRGDTLMQGYLKEGVITPAVDGSGWFASGDLGRWHAEQLLVCGRVDNLIISGGENIQPEEVEQALLMHPDVVQAAVVAVPDPEYGHRPVAFLRMHRGAASAIKWSLWLADKLARFKIPDFFWDWPAEAEPGLKVNRRQLEQLARRYRDGIGPRSHRSE